MIPGALLVFLIQTCAMDYFRFSGVCGNLMIAYLAVVIVSCGKKGAFCASCMIGILMETTLSQVQALYIICYPVLTMLWAQATADKTERQREKWAVLHPNRVREELPPFLRILFAAAGISGTMEVILLGYVYLNGVPITWVHIGRSAVQIGYTVLLSMAAAFPIRAALGMYRRSVRRVAGEMR